MNNIEFLNEMKDYISQRYAEFEEFQRINNETLDEFHRVCQKNGIRYSMAFGSLLGCIRDKGNIPWDYDLDVLVPNDDRQRLIEALDKDLGESYYYVYNNNTKDYPVTCLRVCKKGYTYMALHVDVFFQIGCPSDNLSQEKFIKKIFFLMNARHAKYYYKHEKSNRTFIGRLYTKCMSLRYFWLPGALLRKLEEYYINKYPLSQTKCSVSWCEVYKRVYPSDYFFNYQELRLNNSVCMIISEFDKYLKLLYGDYNKYLPIEKRFTEFYSMFNFVVSRQDYYTTLQSNK